MIYHLIEWISLLGVMVFAISGALCAAEKQMDILGFILIGTVTGVGGGTLRDLLLGIVPVSWVRDPLNVYVCVTTSIIMFFTIHLIKKRKSWILWMDALGLIAFAVMGSETALTHTGHPLIAVVMGVMTATFGGLMRDVRRQLTCPVSRQL